VAARGELVRAVHFRGPPTCSDHDSGVLARIVRLADAHDKPGGGAALQQVTRLENLVGEPVLPTAVGIDDRERAGQLSPSARPGAMAQARVTAEGELLTLGDQRTAFREFRRDLREVLEARPFG